MREPDQIPFDMPPADEPSAGRPVTGKAPSKSEVHGAPSSSRTSRHGGGPDGNGPDGDTPRSVPSRRFWRWAFSLANIAVIVAVAVIVIDARRAYEGCLAAEATWDTIAATLASDGTEGPKRPADCSWHLRADETRRQEAALRDDAARLRAIPDEAASASPSAGENATAEGTTEGEASDGANSRTTAPGDGTTESERSPQTDQADSQADKPRGGMGGILGRMERLKGLSEGLLTRAEPKPGPVRDRLQEVYDRAVAAGDAGEDDEELADELEEAYDAYFDELYPGRRAQLFGE